MPSVLNIGKIRNIRFVGNLILNIHTTFLDDNTVDLCVIFLHQFTIVAQNSAYKR